MGIDHLLEKIVENIQKIPDLQGSVIGLEYNSNLGGYSKIAFEGNAMFLSYQLYSVIVSVSEASQVGDIQLSELQEGLANAHFSEPEEISPEKVTWQEGLSTGLSCGGAVLSWAGVVGGAGAAMTGVGTVAGIALFVSSWSGAITGTLQCGDGVVKMVLKASGHYDWLQKYNENTESTMKIVEYVDNASAAVNIGVGAKKALKYGGKWLSPKKFIKLKTAKGLQHLSKNEKANLYADVLARMLKSHKMEDQVIAREIIYEIFGKGKGRKVENYLRTLKPGGSLFSGNRKILPPGFGARRFTRSHKSSMAKLVSKTITQEVNKLARQVLSTAVIKGGGYALGGIEQPNIHVQIIHH